MTAAAPDDTTWTESRTPGTAREPAAADTVAVAWTVRLLGAVEADNGQQVVDHFSTRAVAQLLARLALRPDRAHPREELIELLWPGVAIGVGRNRLRQTLSTLRTLLERQTTPRATVIQADRVSVRVVPGSIDCDVRLLERMMRADRPEGARALLRGEFMPGHYEDWVIVERQRVDALHERLSHRSSSPLPPVVPTGLPNYWTRAFGQDAQLAQLEACVQSNRLVTLHGAGGSGKTRLAVALARTVTAQRADADGPAAQPSFDRVAFVSLTDCVSRAEVLAALGSTLQSRAGVDPLTGVLEALAERTTLLVLDNGEQLADDAAVIFARLLTELPSLHLLLTSRRLFDLDGERSVAISGLALPDESAAETDLLANPAVALFLERARAVASHIKPATSDVAEVATLVRYLGGVPLAIELAASRMRAMTPRQLLAKLQSAAGSPMLDQLARRQPGDGADLRHASMRRVITSSWAMLSAAQMTLLQTLSVLPSPARLEALAATADIAPEVAHRLLEQLHESKLVDQVTVDDSTRYALLQPVREFAAERVDADAARHARAALRRWLIDHCRGSLPHDIAAVRTEDALIQTAFTSARSDDAVSAAVELALVLRPYWEVEPVPGTVMDALEALLPRIDDRAVCGDIHALLAYGRGAAGAMRDGLAHATAALALADNDTRRAVARCAIVSTTFYSGGYHDQLDAQAEQAAALARRCGQLRAQAVAIGTRAVIACNVHQDFERAERLMAECQVLFERLGSRRMSNRRLLARATLWWGLGRRDEGMAMLHECERTGAELQDWECLMSAGWQRTRFLIRQRRWHEALAANQAVIRICWQHHLWQHMPELLMHLPEALVMLGRPEAAARLQGFALHRYERERGPINVIEAREVKAGRRMIRLHLGAARAEALRIDGVALSMKQAVALALGD